MTIIASAIVFVIALFIFERTSLFSNIVNYNNTSSGDGLVYNNEVLGDLVIRDSDGDGILDWEESLWGTNPLKKDSDGDGVPDNIEIEKMKKAAGITEETDQDLAKLTETDKFSREFFSTVATLNQAGEVDQTTADQLSSSLVDRIQNTPQKKIFTLADLKITKNETKDTIKTYNNGLDTIQTRYPNRKSTIEILNQFAGTADSVNPEALKDLDPTIIQLTNIVKDLSSMEIPPSLAPLHLNFLNTLESLVENLNDIKLYDTDSVIALGAISKYQTGVDDIQAAATNLADAINQKLNN